ncbi:ABC transporter substrate-binding protein [Caballeronia sp. LZ008]|uniref:ABC transporter substrate-binding protein n=1 Tax=unclassified Caballeronia TaxID=2646786 RepID=UPI002027C6D5|nr:MULTISPECIES: ABC transporter substrate-binding protein [unclassified Caballeronia]MDR5798163.1 ABC transporter substrate-binding protein [Caballeronia sp. LZ008]
MALAPAAGAVDATSDRPVYGGTLRVALESDLKTLDPAFSVNWTERQPLYLIFNTLLSINKDASIGPELAEKWETQDGGKRLALYLRKNVLFHDGTPFDAAAAKFNLDRCLDPATGSPLRSGLSAIVDSVTVLEPYALELRLKTPSPALLGMLAQREGFMASPTAVRKYGKDFATNPVGTGPFLFRQWTPGNSLSVVKNPHYWEPGKPYLDSIVFNDVANVVVGVQRLRTGEADYVSALSPIDIRQVQNQPEIRLDRGPASRWYALQWQVDRAPFNNFALRQAIAYALDRKRMVDILMSGKVPLAESIAPPGAWWFDPALRSYPYDAAKSKALLAQAGLSNLQLTLATPDILEMQQINQLVQEQLKAVGIAVRLDPVAQSDWYPRVIQGAINFSPMRWAQRPDPDGLMPLLFASTGAQNSTKYRNPEVDRLFAVGRSTTDEASRAETYRKIEGILTHDLPYVPLFFSVEYAAMRNVVHNHLWIPDEIPRFRNVWKSAA